MCANCPHESHIGPCGLPIQRHGIEDQCQCFTRPANMATQGELEIRARARRIEVDLAEIENRRERPKLPRRRGGPWRRVKGTGTRG